ncbi:hypothetical protein PHLCEN_2v5487 [Hermanssonia centrifuga]|uniref:Uncharacterized protein n=1 Tax=Hermanssonia centrifuga TaxID=98765 RepID=A0A2R6P2S4_9APHY|nr:hypothetical protein PHLCEN_2v5487 [Hermanssonia centrifuga]
MSRYCEHRSDTGEGSEPLGAWHEGDIAGPPLRVQGAVSVTGQDHLNLLSVAPSTFKEAAF